MNQSPLEKEEVKEAQAREIAVLKEWRMSNREMSV